MRPSFFSSTTSRHESVRLFSCGAIRFAIAPYGADAFLAYAKENGIAGDGPFAPESYDAGALIVLAMQAAGSADRVKIQSNMAAVANAPGQEIGPGELDKALQILADGGQVNYQGATNVEFNEVGEVFGTYKGVSC